MSWLKGSGSEKQGFVDRDSGKAVSSGKWQESEARGMEMQGTKWKMENHCCPRTSRLGS